MKIIENKYEDPVTIHQPNMMRDDITDIVMCWVYINDLKPNL